jgi:hypothetical protein
MILLRWKHRSVFVMSARRYVAFAQHCCRETLSLPMNFVLYARISAKPAPQSAENTNIRRLCGKVPRPASAVLRRAGRLPKLGPFETPHRTAIFTEETILMNLTWHGSKGWSGYLAGKNSTQGGDR